MNVDLSPHRLGGPIEPRESEIGRLSVDFLLEQVTTGIAGLSSRDALLVLAINQANIVPLTREPEARRLYGKAEAPAPDAHRRPASINAIAGSLRIPFETARRRIRKLESEGVCQVTRDGVIVPESFLASPAYLESIAAAHTILVRFYMGLRDGELLDPLPAPNYSEDEPPVRAAVRLLSDYILRSAEVLMAEMGDLISVLVLLAVMSGDARPGSSRGVTVAGMAQRLNVPEETVRRHAQQLVERRYAERVGRRFLIAPEMAGRPAFVAFFRENAVNVQRLFAGLAERGVVEVWDKMRPPPGLRH